MQNPLILHIIMTILTRNHHKYLKASLKTLQIRKTQRNSRISPSNRVISSLNYTVKVEKRSGIVANMRQKEAGRKVTGHKMTSPVLNYRTIFCSKTAAGVMFLTVYCSDIPTGNNFVEHVRKMHFDKWRLWKEFVCSIYLKSRFQLENCSFFAAVKDFG